MSNRPYVTYNILEAVYQQMKSRTEFYAFPQQAHLAVRITADTEGAVRCPNYDTDRQIEPVPDDEVCLGVGWVIPEGDGKPIQRGYLHPVLFDVVLVPGEVREVWTQQGVTWYPDMTMAYWPPRQILPKKGDVLIVTLPIDPRILPYYEHERRTHRYVIEDVETPSVLGSQTLLYRARMEPRRGDSIVYDIPPKDRSGVIPGTWD